MELVSVAGGRIPEAAAALAEAMLDEPVGRWLYPDQDEFLDVYEPTFVRTIMRAMDEGRVDAWGDPFVGVAVWLEQPVIGEESPRSQSASGPPLILPEHATARVEELGKLLQRMRRQVRPDHHVYLDSIGVLPDHGAGESPPVCWELDLPGPTVAVCPVRSTPSTRTMPPFIGAGASKSLRPNLSPAPTSPSRRCADGLTHDSGLEALA